MTFSMLKLTPRDHHKGVRFTQIGPVPISVRKVSTFRTKFCGKIDHRPNRVPQCCIPFKPFGNKTFWSTVQHLVYCLLPRKTSRFKNRHSSDADKPYSRFVSDVTAAMLVGKNNNLFLRWELNFIIMQILRKEIVLYYQPTWPPCHVGANREFQFLNLG